MAVATLEFAKVRSKIFVIYAFQTFPSAVLIPASTFRVSMGLYRSKTIALVGMARCAVPARSEAQGGTNVVRLTFLMVRFRRLTLRSATGTAQRAVPTRSSVIVRERHNPAFRCHPFCLKLVFGILFNSV